MKPTTIKDAFDLVDVEPSPAFRDRLRAQLIESVTRAEPSAALVRADREEIVTAQVISVASVKPRRRNVVVGLVAATIVAALLTAVVLTRRSAREEAGPGHDLAIAGAALMTPEELGAGWTQRADGGGSTKLHARVAATVPICAPYLDAAFDSPGLNVTTERDFQSEVFQPLTNIVYVFTTEEAATAAMNKMAEDGFQTCFNTFIDALTPSTGGFISHTTTAAAPTFAKHGDRQVVVPQEISYTGQGSFTVISFFIQVGRGIVYVDPVLRKSDPTDSSGKLEAVVAAATDALAAVVDKSRG